MIAQLKHKTTAVAAALALTTVMAAPAAAQRPARSVLNIPVVGTVTGGTFAGTLALTQFVAQGGELIARGTLTGIVTTAAGATSVITSVATPVNLVDTTCQILHLDLGPLDLNVLGLQVDLSQIVLDITAQPGPGNLFGNLLCAVAGLLDNPNALAGLLNKILDVLSGL